MSNEQPYALLLADWLEDQYDPMGNKQMSAIELRRLHALNAQMLEALKSAIQTADFQDNPFRPWHAKARAAIAAATEAQQ